MSEPRWVRGIDIAILCSFPGSLLLFVVFAAMIHNPRLGLLGGIGSLIAVSLFLLLPVWVVLRIVYDRGRTRAPVLWVESGLAALWLAYDIGQFIEAQVVAAIVGGAVGVAVLLTPLTTRLLRASPKQTPGA